MIDRLALGIICILLGFAAGTIAQLIISEHTYSELAEEAIADCEARCLQTVRDNYAKEQTTRKLLLHELGEALDLDTVELPSFGYVLLKDAFEIPEDIVEACIGYNVSEDA